MISFYWLGEKYKIIFVHLLVLMKTLKFAFEIYWPLGGRQNVNSWNGLTPFFINKFMIFIKLMIGSLQAKLFFLAKDWKLVRFPHQLSHFLSQRSLKIFVSDKTMIFFPFWKSRITYATFSLWRTDVPLSHYLSPRLLSSIT